MNMNQVYQYSVDMKSYVFILYGLALGTKGDILEIGVRRGQSTWAFLNGLKGSDRTLFSIDLNPPKEKISSPNWYFIQGDSKSPPNFLLKRKFSIIMIDGDHSSEGVRKDWENYSPLCEKGGFVIFHDILLPHLGVKAFWEELQGEKLTLDFNKWGLGIRRMR